MASRSPVRRAFALAAAAALLGVAPGPAGAQAEKNADYYLGWHKRVTDEATGFFDSARWLVSQYEADPAAADACDKLRRAASLVSGAKDKSDEAMYAADKLYAFAGDDELKAEVSRLWQQSKAQRDNYAEMKAGLDEEIGSRC